MADGARRNSGSRRERVFVGRSGELAALRGFLADPSLRVASVIGPGGMGKSALLGHLGRFAAVRGRPLLVLDGESLPVATDVLERACERLAPSSVVFIDGFERLESIWAWCHRHLLPSLPRSTQVVLASRKPLPARWRAEPSWQRTSIELTLSPLAHDEAVLLATQLGVEPHAAVTLSRASGGLPLLLCILCLVGKSGPLDEALARVGVDAIVDVLVDRVSDPARVTALYVSGLARAVDETMLTRVVGVTPAEARQLYDWLRVQPFFEEDARALRAHALVAQALRRDLARRDPARAAALRRSLTELLVERLAAAPRNEARAQLSDLQRLLAAEPLHFLAGQDDDPLHYLDRSDPPWPEVLASIERFEGPESAALARAWRAAGRAELHVVRGIDERAVAYAVMVRASARDAHAVGDPLVSATFAQLDAAAPLEHPAEVEMARFWGSLEHHHRPCSETFVLFDLFAVSFTWSEHAVAGFSCQPEPERWLSLPDFSLALLGRATVDGRPCGAFGLDLRHASRRDWISRFVGRVHGERPTDDARLAGRPATFERGQLVTLVKRALRDYHAADRLAKSPLLDSPLARRHGAGIEALRAALVATVRALGSQGEDGRQRRVLEETFLAAPAKQLSAAEASGLTYATYRRVLARAIDQVVAAFARAR